LTELFCRCSRGVNDACTVYGIYTLSVLLISRAVSTLRSAKNGGFFTQNLFDRKRDLMREGRGRIPVRQINNRIQFCMPYTHIYIIYNILVQYSTSYMYIIYICLIYYSNEDICIIIYNMLDGQTHVFICRYTFYYIDCLYNNHCEEQSVRLLV